MSLPDPDAQPASYQRWAALCREVNADAERSRRFREQRYAFNHRLARHLVENLPARRRDQVIYAVHLAGDHPCPAYLGTSTEGHRRLWDLPVGESHHLSNTYPPETWERVTILHWRQVLMEESYDLTTLAAQVGEHFPVEPAEVMKLIGMGIEFLFQKETNPELNIRIKLRRGGFRKAGLDTSASRQALIARRWMEPLFPILWDHWQKLGAAAAGHAGPALHTPTGSVVFPTRIFAEMLAEG